MENAQLTFSRLNIVHVVRGTISSIFCSNSEANASELLQNIEEIFLSVSRTNHHRTFMTKIPHLKRVNDLFTLNQESMRFETVTIYLILMHSSFNVTNCVTVY